MSLGFEQAGFEVVAAFDVDPIHVEIHKKNFPGCKTVCADLSALGGSELRRLGKIGEENIDVLFGGPPCSGFSVGGKRQLDDPRNELLAAFGRFVKELRPSYFVVENVAGLLYGKMKNVVEDFAASVAEGGYSIVEPIQTLEAFDFGVPQRRRRAFILGYAKGLGPPKYPEPFRPEEDGGAKRPTVWDAIADLDLAEAAIALSDSDVFLGELGEASEYASILRGDAEDPDDDSPHLNRCNGSGLGGCSRSAHSQSTVARFAATKQGSYEPISRYYRLPTDGPAHTLRAGTGSDYGSFTAPRPIHPTRNRCITVREAARLHSFPDWFVFHSTKWHGFRQVGNAVPPMLARAVAKQVIKALSNSGQ